MAKQPLHGLLDRFIDQFATVIASRAEAMLARASRAGGGVAAGMRGTRICPFPGCKNPGKGPRNRWFCQQHAKSVPVREQKRLLAERAKSGGAALVVRGRGGANKGRKLDMSCRVGGCKNVSRGPRFGFICDEHRKKLSEKEQAEVRANYNAKKKAK